MIEILKLVEALDALPPNRHADRIRLLDALADECNRAKLQVLHETLVEQAASGEPLASIARRYGVSRQYLHKLNKGT